MATKTAAEKAFLGQFTSLIGYDTAMWSLDGEEMEVSVYEPLDEARMVELTQLFTRYGSYLELIGGNTPVGETRVFIFSTNGKALDALEGAE